MIYAWQQSAFEKLHLAWKQNRLPHALLLAGAKGMGKQQFSQQLTAMLLCEKPDENGQACGQCKSCHLLRNNNHPDFLSVEAVESGQIKIEQNLKKGDSPQIREAVEFCNLTSNYGQYKIVQICPAEGINRNAANALLKTLEEPPEKTLLLLICHNRMQLLPTIRSRCQLIDFSRPDQHLTKQWVEQHLEKQMIDADLLLYLSNGAPLAALTLAEKWETRTVIFQDFKLLLSTKEEPLALVENWLKQETKQLLAWLISWTEDLIRIKLMTQHIFNQDLAETLFKIADQFQIQTLFSILELELESWRILLSTSNVRPQGLLETITISWFQAAKGQWK